MRTKAWKLRHGFDSIAKPTWTTPIMHIERGKWAAGVKASFGKVLSKRRMK